MPPGLLFEDDHLLVFNKPAGLNTHAPSPYAGEGLYDWLRHREPRWADLAIIHRLDKETSGIIVFSKTPTANRSLTEQFTNRRVRKKYILLTDRPVPDEPFTVKSTLVRAGERYLSRPPHAGKEVAETHFHRSAELQLCATQIASATTKKSPSMPAFGVRDSSRAGALRSGSVCAVEAEPFTGRTHQIRVHAAERGFPILGDTLYGGTPAARVFLHAAALTLYHPVSGAEMVFRAEPDFATEPLVSPRLVLRTALLDPYETNAYRVLHGASDGWPGWYVERLGGYLLSQSEQPLSPSQRAELERLMEWLSLRGVYHKPLTRQVRKTSLAESSPALLLGDAAPDRFSIRENGLQFELSFGEGYSVGLFLDQRDNRRRFLTGHIAGGFSLFCPRPSTTAVPRILNAFAYTCGFSVCAAKAGAHATSLDLSRKYLDWGKRNFVLNNLDPAGHDFIYGDVFDWLRRLAKKGRSFEVIALDPPTFSQSKESGVFRATKDYGRLVFAALPLLAPGGVLFVSTNAAEWPPEAFLADVESAVRATGRRIQQKHYVPQPPDFPVSRGEPAYLKTVWLRVD